MSAHQSIGKEKKSTDVPKASTPSGLKLSTYITGYLLSVGLTLCAYLLVTHQSDSHYWFVVSAIAVLAIAQFLVQITYFLHISFASKERWRLVVLLFMMTIVLILVIGSIWIMNNLNYRMTPQQMNTYMQDQDSL